MGALEPWHLVIVLVIVLLLFGPGKLPQVGKAIGDSFRDFKKATTDDTPPTSTHTAASTQVLAGPTCPHCKAPVAANARFCGACGTSIAAI